MVRASVCSAARMARSIALTQCQRGKPMSTEITIQSLADAVQLTKYQVEAWISRGHFKPENSVDSGKRREFTFHDALVLVL